MQSGTLKIMCGLGLGHSSLTCGLVENDMSSGRYLRCELLLEKCFLHVFIIYQQIGYCMGINMMYYEEKRTTLRRVSQICLVSVNRPTDLGTKKTRDSESGVNILLTHFERILPRLQSFTCIYKNSVF